MPHSPAFTYSFDAHQGQPLTEDTICYLSSFKYTARRRVRINAGTRRPQGGRNAIREHAVGRHPQPPFFSPAHDLRIKPLRHYISDTTLVDIEIWTGTWVERSYRDTSTLNSGRNNKVNSTGNYPSSAVSGFHLYVAKFHLLIAHLLVWSKSEDFALKESKEVVRTGASRCSRKLTRIGQCTG